MNILNYNSINVNQMPHFIHHILWFSGHWNCFPSNYEEKWLPFLGLHSLTSEFQTLRIHTKIETFILTNTTCTRKTDGFSISWCSQQKIHYTLLAWPKYTCNQTVRTIHARTRPTESYMNVNTRTVRGRVKWTSLFATVSRTICLTVIWLYYEMEAAEVNWVL
jgi:hypothetical protein